MRLRLQGVLLFLFIPLVLWLFLAQPKWPAVALAAGVVIMLAHRRLAGPFLAKNVSLRSAWTGAELPQAEAGAPRFVYRVLASGREWPMHFSSEAERERAARFFTLAHEALLPLRFAILAPLLYFLVMESLRIGGVVGDTAAVDNWIFRGMIGATTLTVALGYRFVDSIPPERGPVRFPFPVHNVFLLGGRWTLVIFGAVGAWWIIDVGIHVIRRLQAP